MRSKIAAYSFLLTGQWVAWFVLCCLASLLCIYLGSWQMSRAEAMDERNNLIIDNYDAQKFSGDYAISQFKEFDSKNQWNPVELKGSYIPDKTILVRNRAHDGVVGYEVLVPFRTTGGDIVVMNRGWVPTSDAGDGSPSQVPPPPRGSVTVTARLHPGEDQVQRSLPKGHIASIYLPGVAHMTGLDLGLGAYGRVSHENPKPAIAPESFAKPDLDNGPNFSYALQWDAFAVLVFIAYGYSARQKVRNDQWDREYAQQVEKEISEYYDSSGYFIDKGDGVTEEDIVRRLEMVDDMPPHLKKIMRPKRVKRSYAVIDAEEEDALLDARDSRTM